MSRFGMLTPEIIEELKSAAGDHNVIAGDADALENYARDSSDAEAHMPGAVVRPETAEQVSKVMKIASKHRIPVTPRGAGSGLAGGAVPLCGGIVLSLERMNRILEIDVLNRVAVVEPGVITNDLCKAVAEKGFLYAGYPMSTETSFIGGNFATNAGGAKVIRYGSTRRHILGAEVVLASGEILNLGGRYRKDCWGYSLLQLLIGSEGTLGIATKIIVNLEPKPGKTVNLLACFPTLESTVEAVASVVSSGKRVVSCEFIDQFTAKATSAYLGTPLPELDRAQAYLLIQVEGDGDAQIEDAYETVGLICERAGAFEVFVAESRTESNAVWAIRQNTLEGVRTVNPDVNLSGDVVVPLSQMPEMVRRSEELAAQWGIPMSMIAHIADGNIHHTPMKPAGMPLAEWAQYSERFVEALIAEAVRLGGAGSGEHGVGIAKQPSLLAAKTAAEIEIHKGIKAAFDPQGILNPGKLVFPLEEE